MLLHGLSSLASQPDIAYQCEALLEIAHVRPRFEFGSPGSQHCTLQCCMHAYIYIYIYIHA